MPCLDSLLAMSHLNLRNFYLDTYDYFNDDEMDGQLTY